MKRFYFLIMTIFFTSIVMSQEIWHRTYSGYKDAATDGVDDAQRNLYVIGSNGSAVNNVISNEESSFVEPSGAFITKLDADGRTLWYTVLDTGNYNFVGESRILYKGNFVYGLFKDHIYKLNRNTGSLIATYNLTTDGDSVNDVNLLDFAVYKMGTVNYLVLVTNDGQKSYVKVIKDNGGSFAYQQHMIIDSDKPGLEKIMMLGEQIYVGGLFYHTTSPSFVSYPSNGTGTVTFSQPDRYLLFNYKLNYNSGSGFGFTFQNILNGGVNEDYPIDNFDIDNDPGLGEYLIYGTGRGTNGNKVYTVFANNFNFQYRYEVQPGAKETFSADEGNVYYSIISPTSPYSRTVYATRINTLGFNSSLLWNINSECFVPMRMVDSTIADVLYPIGYYKFRCELGDYTMPDYNNDGVKTAITRIIENSSGAEYERIGDNYAIDAVLSPNPAKDMLNIDVEGDTKGSFEIYNIHNNLIHLSAKNIDLTNIKLNVSSWKKGNYFLRLTTESGEVLKKNFIVK